MTSIKSQKTSGSKKKSKPELTEEEKQEILERADQIREQGAENQLELAKLFLDNEKPDIALRRLQRDRGRVQRIKGSDRSQISDEETVEKTDAVPGGPSMIYVSCQFETPGRDCNHRFPVQRSNGCCDEAHHHRPDRPRTRFSWLSSNCRLRIDLQALSIEIRIH